jgi:hypothetical protein
VIRLGGGAWTRTTWLLFLLVVVTALSTLLKVRDPDLPGTLRLGVLRSRGSNSPTWLSPLAEYLGQELHRRVIITPLSSPDPRSSPDPLDLALLPMAGSPPADSLEVLAWAKPQGRSSWRCRAGILRGSDAPWPPPPGSSLLFGDCVSWDGRFGAVPVLRAWGWEPEQIEGVPCGSDAYDHQTSIAAVVYGAFDYAVVREAEVRGARHLGRLPERGFVYSPVGEARGDFALVAVGGLARSARDRVREAALNLDHYRQDPSRLRARAASEALMTLGFSGFAPVEVLPSLRP